MRLLRSLWTPSRYLSRVAGASSSGWDGTPPDWAIVVHACALLIVLLSPLYA